MSCDEGFLCLVLKSSKDAQSHL
ncbi:protein of unknown function (plasmid) [Azospirillum baldaniorum]|uniref:Uncharacterized protein n=1 Tax=Azospirillum baldaniorum TaxID=1064539 RepID=A0A9P1K1U8_9PROT|nr:protein of unknown function [Azospirillum baldaniorum]